MTNEAIVKANDALTFLRELDETVRVSDRWRLMRKVDQLLDDSLVVHPYGPQETRSELIFDDEGEGSVILVYVKDGVEYPTYPTGNLDLLRALREWNKEQHDVLREAYNNRIVLEDDLDPACEVYGESKAFHHFCAYGAVPPSQNNVETSIYQQNMGIDNPVPFGGTFAVYNGETYSNIYLEEWFGNLSNFFLLGRPPFPHNAIERFFEVLCSWSVTGTYHDPTSPEEDPPLGMSVEVFFTLLEADPTAALGSVILAANEGLSHGSQEATS